MALLGGPSATRIPTVASERTLSALTPQFGREASRLGEVANLFFKDLTTNQTGRKTRALAKTSGDFAQRSGPAATSKAGVINQAGQRGRGLSRLASATSEGFDANQLRQRAKAAEFLRRRQSQGTGLLTESAGNELNVAVAQQGADQLAEGTRQNIIGTGLGAVARLGMGAFANRNRTPEPKINFETAVDPNDFRVNSSIGLA